jgi:TetR/AcrR family transcriptional regulator, transcriptional repressor of aconitase
MPRLIGEELDEKRRTQILEAALYCFLTFGFAKTSMDDIAKRAGVSRPLVYRKFKNKDELFAGVFDYLTAGRFERAMAALKGGGSSRERLLAAFEIMLVEPWTKVIGHPMSVDFYEMCSLQLPRVTASYARSAVRCAEAVLGNHEAAEVFFFATEGLHSDVPSAKVLLKRLRVLVDHFARD